MKIKNKLIITIFSLPLIATPLALTASDDNVPPIKNKLVLEECGACHLAFQPAFLPAISWEKMMNELENHFGEDASLDKEMTREITNYMMANAQKNKIVNFDNPPLRITELRWFKHEHGEREAKNMLNKKKLNSYVDCAACHKGADKGYYDDD